MGRIVLDLAFAADDSVTSHLVAYATILRALATWNRDRMPAWGIPSLYAGHVVYGTPGHQEFPDAKRISDRGWADCGPLAAYRVGELWRAGERADFRIYVREVPGWGMLYHAQVRRESGEIEDCSRLLGMKSRPPALDQNGGVDVRDLLRLKLLARRGWRAA